MWLVGVDKTQAIASVELSHGILDIIIANASTFRVMWRRAHLAPRHEKHVIITITTLRMLGQLHRLNQYRACTRLKLVNRTLRVSQILLGFGMYTSASKSLYQKISLWCSVALCHIQCHVSIFIDNIEGLNQEVKRGSIFTTMRITQPLK